MSSETLAAYRAQTKANRLGLWLFFVSESFMFGGLLASRFYLWGNTRPDLDQWLGLAVTVILLVSSFTMNRAESAIAHDDRRTFLNNLLVTASLGMLFLIGVVAFEWQGHVKPWDGVFGAVLYGMTGLHALHVFTGVLIILVVWANGRRGAFSAERHWGVEATAIYWHFVDVVWVFYYPALYLMGAVAH